MTEVVQGLAIDNRRFGDSFALGFEDPLANIRGREGVGIFDESSRHALIRGDCREVLGLLPKESVNCVITSPPYWQQREYEVDKEYESGLIGAEKESEAYVRSLVEVFRKVKRVLKPDGSVWLNIGDKYVDKNLMGMPWRVALGMTKDGWILRNDIIWYSSKGTQSAKDRFRDIYEHIFHFVQSKDYYFKQDEVLLEPVKVPKFTNGKIVSATGVNGDKYRKQIEESQSLTAEERKQALAALDETLRQMEAGELVDFRMTIRGQQRLLHSDRNGISGRAKELEKRGYYILKSHSEGYMPTDIWKIVPEDQVKERDSHYAAFPVELLKRPIASTCPDLSGIVLDPFVGTGTSVLAALSLNRIGIGIDISTKYLQIAKDRLRASQVRL